MTPPPPLLELEGIRKSYGDGVTTEVLHGIDLCVREGDLVALIGPSGSGKSTLLNLIGLLDRPSQGRIAIEIGRRLTGLSIRCQISLVLKNLNFSQRQNPRRAGQFDAHETTGDCVSSSICWMRLQLMLDLL